MSTVENKTINNISQKKGKPKRILIIGAGIGGLSAGIYGRMAGYEVDIYEKNPVAGGQCMGWNRRGHHIDNCIHWLTGTREGTAMYQVWKDLGALGSDTEYAACNAFYTCYYDGMRATLWKDLERTERELIQLSPEDEVEIRRFIQHVRYASASVIPAEKPMDMMGVMDYIRMGKEMADMPKVIKEYGEISLQDLADRFQHPLLKMLFAEYMPREYTAYSLLVSYGTMASGNGELPSGGSLAMSNRIVERFLESGGRLHLNMPVKRVILQGKQAVGIELESGGCQTADYVISAVDTMELFSRLVGRENMDSVWRKPYENMEQYPSQSGFQLAYSVDRKAYEEEGTILFECEPFHIGGRSIAYMSLKGYEYEPDFAPEGKIVLQTNVSQFDEDFLYWKSLSKEEYKQVKQEVVQAIEERIIAAFPGLAGHMELLDAWTPLTYERYCNAYHGAYMSFITKKGVKPFRVKGEIKGIQNLYIASQWIMAPGGLPIAAIAGKFAIQRILKKEKRKITEI